MSAYQSVFVKKSDVEYQSVFVAKSDVEYKTTKMMALNLSRGYVTPFIPFRL